MDYKKTKQDILDILENPLPDRIAGINDIIEGIREAVNSGGVAEIGDISISSNEKSDKYRRYGKALIDELNKRNEF